MPSKNHQWVDGKLLQTDKCFSALKNTQKDKINDWLFEEYSKIYDRIGKAPDSRHNDKILNEVYAKIESAEIWIPYGEVLRYFYSKKNSYRKRYEKSKKLTIDEIE